MLGELLLGDGEVGLRIADLALQDRDLRVDGVEVRGGLLERGLGLGDGPLKLVEVGHRAVELGLEFLGGGGLRSRGDGERGGGERAGENRGKGHAGGERDVFALHSSPSHDARGGASFLLTGIRA